MPQSPTNPTVILSSGGIRSLVAMGLTLDETDPQRVTMVHVDDGRPSRRRCADAAARQAEAMGVGKTAELSLTHIHGRGGSRDAEGEPRPVLHAPQVLLAAVGFARRHQASRLVYPASYGLDPEPLSRATERLLLIEQLARDEAIAPDSEIDEAPTPTIDTPLFELTDPQVIELGGQLGVDFALTWTCREDAPHPCQACRACRRRKTAFERAGLADPLLGVTHSAAA